MTYTIKVDKEITEAANQLIDLCIKKGVIGFFVCFPDGIDSREKPERIFTVPQVCSAVNQQDTNNIICGMAEAIKAHQDFSL